MSSSEAPDYSNGQEDEGRAFVYHGSAGGLATTAAWTGESNQANADFGRSVATAGDVNGDGFSEVIVGANYYANGQMLEGRAFVYHGSVGGLATTAAWTAEGNQAQAYFGYSVATAGDVNGDGFSDVIVGASLYDNGQTDEGRAFVYQGSAAGLATTPAWTAESDYFDPEFGFSVATAGDVNGDGFSDVIVGAFLYERWRGGAFVYHGGSDGLAPSSSWFTAGGQIGAGWGFSVATAGDVNGDGYSDIIAIANRYDNGQIDEGRAIVYHGSFSGATTIAWSAETNQAGAELAAAASAGDVNGDGYSDVILGSSLYDGGQIDEGRTFLYLGSPNGLGGDPVWTSEPNQAGAWFGRSVGSAGDVNGDGYSDVIVGAPRYDNGQTDEGRALLYLGSAGGLGGPTWGIEGDQDGAALGTSVGTAGDVNGDGFSDLLIGLPAYDRGQSNEGVVWVFHGSEDGLGASPTRIVEANVADASFGNLVATAGDVNGDGFSDALIGSPTFSNGQTSEGRAFVYHGTAAGLAMGPAWTTEPDQAGAWLGYAAGTAGDVNGDGYSDVVVGALFYDNTVTNEGRVWLYQGSPAGLGAPVWITDGGEPGVVYGISVATGGDVNGDGFSDVLVGAADYNFSNHGEGGVWMFLGNKGDGMHRIRRQVRASEIVPIDIYGRSDSQSAFGVQALARTPAGRGKVKLQIEVKPAGTPFDGTGLLTTSLVQTGVPISDGSSVAIHQLATGLAPGTVHHWRLRIASDSPFFPRSPWLWHPGNAVTEGDVRTGGTATAIADGSPAPASHLRLGPGTPNPFSSRAEFSYALPIAGRARLSVYDAQGRLVAELADEERRPGQYAAAWDGRDTRGDDLPSGVYFLKLQLAGQVAAQKIVKSR